MASLEQNESDSIFGQRKFPVYDEKALIEGIFNNDFILVVGSGVVLNKEMFPASCGDVNRYILQEINERKKKKEPSFGGYDSFTQISYDYPDYYTNPIQELLSPHSFSFNVSDMSPELVKLLKTRLFKCVLTTTVDSYLETLMKEIWGDKGLRVVDIMDQDSLTDFREELRSIKMDGNAYDKPTLFYVFGRAQNKNMRRHSFVESDKDAIRTIEKWMKLDNDGKDLIVPFLKQKHFISLGCKFDDWYFRFFWYIITRNLGVVDSLGDNSPNITNNIAMTFSSSESDRSLRAYLSESVSVCIHDDVWKFMTRLERILTDISPGSPFGEMVLENKLNSRVFISYKSEDIKKVGELFCKFKTAGVNVWFDLQDIRGGDNFEKEIKPAIEQSRVFIPLLTANVADDLRKKGTEITDYYVEEWRYAKEKGLTFFPVAVPGYSVRGPEHKIFCDITDQRETSGIDMSEITNAILGYDKVIHDLKDVLKNE